MRIPITVATLLVSGGLQALSQEVTLGAASFDSTSDQVPANWYWPISRDATMTYKGYGEHDGKTRTETFRLGEVVSGVKAVHWQIQADTPAVPKEDWWLAVDLDGDLRVLQYIREGVVVFAATSEATPPVFLPGSPADAATWTLFGETKQIEWVVVSQSSSHLKLNISAPGKQTTTLSYRADSGVHEIVTDSSFVPAGSGWTLQPPLVPTAQP